MSIEIFAKAKEVYTNTWVNGNLVLSHDVEEKHKAIIIPKEYSGMYLLDWQTGDDLGFECWYMVKQETICQYTGLEDKCNKEIFTNDKFTHDGHLGTINFGPHGTGEHGFYIEWQDGCGLRTDLGYWHDKIEICGNVFDEEDGDETD